MSRIDQSSSTSTPDSTTMPEPQPDRAQRVLDDVAALTALAASGIEPDGQVIQVADSTWIIYGHAGYEVTIVGEYQDAVEAMEVLRAAPHHDPDRDGPAR
jgi:hypothetical protein